MNEPDTGLALTLHQPWASAIIEGPKRIENRDWPPPPSIIGRRLWIHAGKTYDDENHAAIAELWPGLLDRDSGSVPMSAILGSVVVVGAVHEGGRFLGRLSGSTEALIDNDWFAGPYGWVLSDVKAIRPVPCRGHQKIWTVPTEILVECRRLSL